MRALALALLAVLLGACTTSYKAKAARTAAFPSTWDEGLSVAAIQQQQQQAATRPALTEAAPPPARSALKGKLAVLDLRRYASELSEQDVRYFTDIVRGATLKAAPGLDVMTRENLVVLLQASGKDLAACEGECEVDTGRRIGADLIVSGEVLKVGTRLKVSLKLHDTHEGRLISTVVANGKSVEELDDGLQKAAAELFASR